MSFFFLVLVIGNPLSTIFTIAGNPCGEGSKEQDAKKVLLIQTANRLLRVIKKKDIVGFVGLLSRRGAGFGVDQPFQSVGQIKNQLEKREGVYCLLFSTQCISTSNYALLFSTDPVLSKWKISYSEWLNTSQWLAIEGELLDAPNGDFCGGLVTAHRREGSKNAPDVIELEFIFENGRWRLANTPYELGG